MIKCRVSPPGAVGVSLPSLAAGLRVRSAIAATGSLFSRDCIGSSCGHYDAPVGDSAACD